MPSLRRSCEIRNELGLHARAAAQLVNLAQGFRADLTIAKDGKSVNGKSIMGLMMLVVVQGSTIDIEAKGEDAAQLLDAIGALIEARFNESQ